MAAVSSPVRQPFGFVDNCRLRNLTNLKNRQNALPISLSSPVKRRYSPPTDFSDNDAENVDPSSFTSPSKKAKNFDGLPNKPAKTSQFFLTEAVPSATTYNKPSVRLDTSASPLGQRKKTATPSTAPAVAGRSPKSKRIGILSRRRTASSPFTRIDPPSFSINKARHAAPFSIDAALTGTIPSYAPVGKKDVYVPTIEESTPRGWMFDIYEDTVEDEMGNLMEHSTGTLDISDDESRRAAKDDRGKENIPPLDQPTASTAINGTVAAAPSRRHERLDEMIDEPRTPMGELNAKDFYADGCDASSYAIVPAEKYGKSTLSPPQVEVKTVDTPALPLITAATEKQEGWKEFLNQVEESKKNISSPNIPDPAMEKQPEIEIWESESAKGDEDEEIKSEEEQATLDGESAALALVEAKVENELMA
ncbi:MAG: hypothetical protein M1830_010441 [Pleopsidium flavum]|nr:MAG: hypothetical protein M1830_010441 [Pleopsidium flavum]